MFSICLDIMNSPVVYPKIIELERIQVTKCDRSLRLHLSLFQPILVATYVNGEIEDEVLGGNKQRHTEIVYYEQRVLFSIFFFY